jgi:WD40 repeat protein
MRYSPDGRLVAVGASVRRVRLFDVVEGKEAFDFEELPYWLAFSPDGRFFVGQKAVWDLRSRKPAFRIPGNSRTESAVVLPGSNRLIAGCQDSMIRVWDLTSGRLLKSVSGHTAPVCAMAISQDGKRLATGSTEPPQVAKP